jgi:hypothetical protein
MDAEGGAAAPGGEDEPMTPDSGDETVAGAPAEGHAADRAEEAPPMTGRQPESEMEAPAVSAQSEGGQSDAAAPAAAAAATPPTDEFMRDLVDAMRRVADEARDTGVAELRADADEQIRKLEADADRRRGELRERADQDVAAVAEWERAEQERITKEAEQRVVARRAQLDQQLAAETSRTEAETRAVRERVAEYERELEAYHAQLIDINDPAAFAAAAKRMPKAPSLVGGTTAPAATDDQVAAPAAKAPAPALEADDQAPVEPMTAASNGVPEPAVPAEPAQEGVLAARLAELDASLPQAEAEAEASAEAAPAAAPAEAAATTEVVVKGLGSFGAITGFRQALSGVAGVDAVALSLGQTGEFVFRASHAPGFDVRAAIAQLEGDGAKIEDRPEGGLRVTLERPR